MPSQEEQGRTAKHADNPLASRTGSARHQRTPTRPEQMRGIGHASEQELQLEDGSVPPSFPARGGICFIQSDGSSQDTQPNQQRETNRIGRGQGEGEEETKCRRSWKEEKEEVVAGMEGAITTETQREREREPHRNRPPRQTRRRRGRTATKCPSPSNPPSPSPLSTPTPPSLPPHPRPNPSCRPSRSRGLGGRD